MEFYEGHVFISNSLNNDVCRLILQFEPDSRTYAINRRPDPIVEWNKFALSRELCYGCKSKKINKSINRQYQDIDPTKNILVWHWHWNYR